MTTRLLSTWLTTAALMGTMTLLATKPAMAADIVIALSAPTTGTDAPLADPVVKGYRLAIEQAAKDSTLPGKVFESVQDDQDKPEVGATVARKLCGTDNVVGVVGNFASSINLAAGPVYEDCGLARVSATASNNSLTTKGWKDFFRICSRNSDQITQGMSWIKGNWADVKTIAIVTGNDNSGQEIARQVTDFWQDRGVKMISRVKITAGTSDFRGVLTTLIADKPDLIFVGLFDTDAGLLVKQARQLGYPGRFFGTDAIASPNFIQIGGADSTEGIHMTDLGFDPTGVPAAAGFVAAYQAAYHEAPSAYAVNAYDATMVLIEAWKKTGGKADRQAVRDALASGTFPSTFGSVTFTPTGDIATPRIGIYKVAAGKIAYVARSQQTAP